jgi:hypothetical protein
MIDNHSFELTDKQLSDLNNWVRSLASPLHREGCSESIEINVQFNFSIFGRTVEASLGSSDAKITIEDCLEQFLD